MGREAAEGILKEEYRENLKMDEAIELAAKCLVKVLEARGEKARVRLAVVSSKTKRFKVLNKKEAEAI